MRVIPRARRTEVGGMRQDVLVVRLTTAPVDGAANEQLIRFLAGLLDVPRRTVTIAGGRRGREKRISVTDISPEQLAARVAALLSR